METVNSANSYLFLVFLEIIYQVVNKGTGVSGCTKPSNNIGDRRF